MNEQLALVGDETVEQFKVALARALADFLEVPDGFAWCIGDLASEWLIACLFPVDQEEVDGYEAESEYDSEMWRIPYVRTADGFTFGEPVPVQATIVYEPIALEPEEESTKHVPWLTIHRRGNIGKIMRRVKKVMRTVDPTAAMDAVENPSDAQRSGLPEAAYAIVVDGRKVLPHHVNTARDPDDDGSVDLPRLRNALARWNQVRGLSAEQKAQALRHLEGHAKRLKIGKWATESAPVCSLTERKCDDGSALTVDTVRFEDVQVLRDSVEAAPNGKPFLAVLEGRGAVAGKINRNGRLYLPEQMNEACARLSKRIRRAKENGSGLNFDLLVGEADHPDSAPRLLATCTQLVDVTYQAGDVRVRFGVMDTSAGRDVVALASYGVPIGVSTRSLGRGRSAVMNESNPYWRGNEEFDGEDYEEVYEFDLQAFDLVVDPAARTFLGEQTSAQPEITEALDRIECARITESNGSTHEGNVSTTETQTEQAPPAIETPAVESAVVIPTVTPESDNTVARLEDKLRATEEVVESLRKLVDTLVQERNAARAEMALSTAVENACVGKLYGDLRRAAIRKAIGNQILDDYTEAVSKASADFDLECQTIAQTVAQPITENTDGGAKPAPQLAELGIHFTLS